MGLAAVPLHAAMGAEFRYVTPVKSTARLLKEGFMGGGRIGTVIASVAAVWSLALTVPALADVQADSLFAASKLRFYCKACHAIGDLKFIRSDDDAQLWAFLFREKSPHSGKIWADAIAEVLNWPSDVAPPFDPLMDPTHQRDWMPRGSKRLDLAADLDGGASVRREILSALKASQAP